MTNSMTSLTQQITATSISQGLYDFLSEWLEAAKGDHFYQKFTGTGLCSETPKQLKKELREALPYAGDVCQLGEPTERSEYPFNFACASDYHQEVHSDRVHENPQRLAWVKGMLKLPITQ
ncbi:hypothetical protein NoPa_00114 [Pseudomonas phage vB_PpuM-NoPa]|uniref:Uncharacterized protein n=1 Tax=Pseudomonas phage vB_PpuM-NoPa TaxID=3132619 RepID=A0AAX4MZ86_9CAUD